MAKEPESPDCKPGDDSKPGDPVKSCPLGELVVNVKDADGDPVKDVDVNAGKWGNKKTDKDGVADYGKVKSGTDDVTATKKGHAPKRNDPEGKDEKKGVNVPAGGKTVVDLVQHPLCANVAMFEGPTTRSKYYGFDHKTNIVATENDKYWKPVPAHGAISMTGKLHRDGGRWVSVAKGKETELEIEFKFKGTKCIPCIENTTYEIAPADIAEVVTKKVTAEKAAFKIKGLKKGEASLKVMCDGNEIGWFHIWCAVSAKIKVDIVCIKTAKAPSFTYSVSSLENVFKDIYKQAALKIDMKDLGTVDLSSDTTFTTSEAKGYSGTGRFLAKTGTAPNRPYDAKSEIINAMNTRASIKLNARTTNKPRSGAKRIYWYVPTAGAGIGGTVLGVGTDTGFGFIGEGASARNSMAHEFGHILGLRHPSDGSSTSQFATHNRSTKGTAVSAFTATNTEPATAAASAHGNVMANDPANLMGYWSDKPNRKWLRYHQWKAAKRS